MDLYHVSLFTGGAGLGLMALGGLSHGSHSGDSGGHAGHGAAHAHDGGLAVHGGVHAAHGDAHAHGGTAVRDGGFSFGGFQSLLSPRVLFALMIGFGAGGLLATPLGEPWRAGAAVLAAAAFEALLVGPIWRFLFRFESSPALTLESAIEDDARAVTGFDANGCGLVAVDVDGQVVQLLATLAPDERARGARVRSGDTVRISAVDAARNQCTVRTLGR